MGTNDDSSGTGVPAEPGERPSWTALSPADKRARIIDAAIAVFSEQGLEAPMHLVAERSGAGVASIYRLFESKHDLFAAIVIRRYGELSDAFETALAAPGDRWSALLVLLRERVEHQSPEPFSIEARALVEDRPEVQEAVAGALRAQEQLLAAAREEGRMRADATTEDFRLLFTATRAARRTDPASVPRMLALMIDALDGERPGTTPTRETR